MFAQANTRSENDDLLDRAKVAARHDPEGEAAKILGVVGIYAPPLVSTFILPDFWTVWRVADRIDEAFETLSRVPVTRGPQGYHSPWPVHRHDIFDRNSAIIGQERDELERQARLQNRVRLSASAFQIEQMHEALGWPMTYLRGMPEVSQAVCFGAIWPERAIAKRCKQLGMTKRTFRRRQMHGLNVIVAGLTRDKVAVR